MSKLDVLKKAFDNTEVYIRSHDLISVSKSMKVQVYNVSFNILTNSDHCALVKYEYPHLTKITDVFCKELLNRLAQGDVYDIPYRLGNLCYLHFNIPPSKHEYGYRTIPKIISSANYYYSRILPYTRGKLQKKIDRDVRSGNINKNNLLQLIEA